jgi:anion-transporting  ArsA/GET3 family ATPase
MTMDTEAALREYLKINLKIPMVGRIGALAQAFDFVANAAPGVREMLTVGKLCWEVREQHFDLVVVDASATGSIVGQLATPVALSELVRIGSVQTQTRWMLDILRDPTQTGVLIVTTGEEMPVNESIELARRLGRETEVQLSAVIANRVLPEPFGRGEEEIFSILSRDEMVGLMARELAADSSVVDEVMEAARVAVRLRRIGAQHLERLRGSVDPAVPIAYLPYLFSTTAGVATTDAIAQSLSDEFGQ